LPIDREEFFVDLAAVPAVEDEVAACANCGASGSAPSASGTLVCAERHTLCGDCGMPCAQCGQILCLVCGTLPCRTCAAGAAPA